MFTFIFPSVSYFQLKNSGNYVINKASNYDEAACAFSPIRLKTGAASKAGDSSMTSKKKVYRRFFVVYASFFVCMLLMLVPIYQLSLNEVEQRTMKTTGAVLSSGLETIEDAMHAASVAAANLYSDQQIFLLAQLSAPISASDGYRILQGTSFYKSVTSVLPLISDSGLYFRNGSMILSNRFFLYANDAYGSFLNDFHSKDIFSWIQRLALLGNTYSHVSMTVSTTAGVRDVVVFSLPLPLNSIARKTFFYAFYDAKDLIDLMVLPQYLSACSLTLQDSSQRLLIQHLPDQTPRRTLSIEAKSDLYGLQATLEIDTSVFSEELRHFRQVILIGSLVYVLIGIGLTLFYSWRNAQPMMRVINAAEETSHAFGVTLDNNADSSFAYIHSFINQMGSEMADSRKALAQQFQQLQESMFDLLLHGMYHDERLQQAKRCFPDFPARCQMILVKLMHTGKYDLEALSAARMQLSEILQAHLPAGVMLHRTNLAQLVIIWPCGEGTPVNDCERMVIPVAQQLRNHTELDVKFAISLPFEGLDRLPAVFDQLRQLIHIVGDSGESIIYAQSTGNRETEAVRQSTARFYELLLRGDVEVALALMDADVEALKKMQLVDETAVQQLFFLYRHALMRVAEEVSGEMAVSLEPPRYLSTLTVDEIFGSLRQCCLNLCSQISLHRQSSEESFERKIIRFIDKHLADSGLCIRMVTDEFNISESNLRRILLKATGGSFLEYVEEQRMQLASSLLTRTSMPVGQIPQHCGYASANSFYKAFKRHFDVSPTQLRERLRQQPPPPGDAQ